MDEDELKALRWRCRRGMQELDILLSAFLEGLPEQTPPVQQAFRKLLESEDDLLWDWLSGRAQPNDEELKDVVRRVRQTAAS